MSEKRLLIIGSGKRVCDAALPALQPLQNVKIHKIFGRKEKTIQSQSNEFAVTSINDLGEADIKQTDIIYIAVKQPGVAEVLSRLSRYNLSRVDLLIETPVIPFHELKHIDLFTRFKNVWVAEDCTRLPCFDLISPGEAKEVHFDRSGYKYHAVALSKMLLGCGEINRAERTTAKGGTVLDTLFFSNGSKATIRSPRDYDNGNFSIKTNDRLLSDSTARGDNEETLKPMLEGDVCKGFVLGERKILLTEEEICVLGRWGQSATITSKMHDLKRVGLYRMFKDIIEEKGSYELNDALDDMAVSYYLDNIGFYKKNSVLNYSSKGGRFLTKVYSKFNRGMKRLR